MKNTLPLLVVLLVVSCKKEENYIDRDDLVGNYHDQAGYVEGSPWNEIYIISESQQCETCIEFSSLPGLYLAASTLGVIRNDQIIIPEQVYAQYPLGSSGGESHLRRVDGTALLMGTNVSIQLNEYKMYPGQTEFSYYKSYSIILVRTS